MPGFDPSTATKEQIREAIMLLNEDFINAKIAPISEEEIQKILAEQEKRLESYEFAKGIRKEIRDIEKFGDDHKFKTTIPFERSRQYIFNRRNTDKAKAANDALEKELKTVEGTEKYLRDLCKKLSKIDEREFYAHGERKQMALLGDDVAFGLLCFELKHVFDNVETEKMNVLSKEEMARFEERIPIYQIYGEYKFLVEKNGSPFNIIMPDRPMDDLMKLHKYYTKNKMTEKMEYIMSSVSVKNARNRTECSKAVVEELAKRGFFGVPDENVTYETFENDTKLQSRSSGIDRVLDEPNRSVRFVKHVKEKVNGQDVIRDYETVINSQDARDLYHSYNLSQKLADKYPQYKGLAFNENARMAAAQKAVILNFLPKVTAQDEFLKDIETKKIDRFIENVLQGKDETVSFIMLQAPEVADKMLIELTSDEAPKRFETSLEQYKKTTSKTSKILHPSEDVINGLFTPKTDPTNIRYVFTNENMPMIGTEVIEAQKKIDAIEITPPQGYTDEDVVAVNYAFFFSKKNLEKNLEFIRNSRGDKSTLRKVTDPVYDGAEYIITDLLADSHRLNTNMIRTLVPDVRTKVKDILTDLTEENKKELVDATKEAIELSTNILRSRQIAHHDEIARLMRTTKAMYDLLDKPEFKDMASFTDEQLKWKKYVEVNYKLLQEMADYENKLSDLIVKKMTAAAYFDDKLGAKLGDDAQIKNVYLEYAARKIYFDKLGTDTQRYESAVTKRYGTGIEGEIQKRSRPLSRMENNCMGNPDEYINHMKEQLGKSNPNYQNMLNLKDSADFLSQMTDRLDDREQSFFEDYFRQWNLNALFTAYIEEAKDKEGYEDLIAEIKELPCMKNPDVLKELSSEERKAEISVYREMAEKIKEKHFVRSVKVIDKEFDAEYEEEAYSTEPLEVALEYVTQMMEKNEGLLRSERAFENKIYVRDLYKERQISDEQVFELAAERKNLYEADLAENECYLDCPTKADYAKLIIGMIDKAKELGIQDSSFDLAVVGLKNCFGSGAEETEIISVMDQLDKAEQKLADQMLDDDSNELRDRYAFVVNLQSKVEAYMDAGTLIEAARDPKSVYGAAYENAKKLEANYKRIQEKESESVQDKKEGEKTLQFRKLASLARGSMENIRNAIRNEALGNTKEGMESLKNGEDLAVVAVFNTLMSADKNSLVRTILEKKGADVMITAAMNSEIMKNKCAELTVEKIGQALAEPQKFNQYLITTDEVLKSEKTASKLHMKADIAQVNGPIV